MSLAPVPATVLLPSASRRTSSLCPPRLSRSLSMWSVTPIAASTLGDVTETWRSLPAAQQPTWPDPAQVHAVVRELELSPGLVVPHECDTLRDRLAAVSRGDAFLLQGGDCAETFAGIGADQVRDKLRTILQMAAVLTYAASVPVVKVGRMAGQFAKPRSADVEAITGLPSYRGDAVNDLAESPDARVPDPSRMLRAYGASAMTLNLIRAYTRGGLADLRAVHDWNKDFVRRSPAGQRYERVARDIDRALAFMRACGIDLDREQSMHGVEFFASREALLLDYESRVPRVRWGIGYASHEALLLDYESPLTRRDDDRGASYDLSAHMVWIGDRT